MKKFFTRRIGFVILLEAFLFLCLALFSKWVWGLLCDETLASCMVSSEWSSWRFALIAVLRPFFLSPMFLLSLVAGSNFGFIGGLYWSLFAVFLSTLAIYSFGLYLGRQYVGPWLAENLPDTWKAIRTQDFKLVFISRWIPIFPLDLMSLLFGLANFRSYYVLAFSLLGSLPTLVVFNYIGAHSLELPVWQVLFYLAAFAAISASPLLVYEYFCRKKGSSLWVQLKRVSHEIVSEVQKNNTIAKQQNFHNERIPIVLLYGFFSSRTTLKNLEKMLARRGFDVMTFNLGGMLGVFFTRGIKETAQFLDRKIRRQMQRHGFEKVHIVAHSKGGLVALWCVLRLGGYQYCDKVVTMGTPFKGSWLAAAALATPLGFFWKDIWQMRPGSKFLEQLAASPVYENVKIYNLYSVKDKVAPDRNGVFEYSGWVLPIAMHQISHFEFLSKASVSDTLVTLLRPNSVELSPGRVAKLNAKERRRFWRGGKREKPSA